MSKYWTLTNYLLFLLSAIGWIPAFGATELFETPRLFMAGDESKHHHFIAPNERFPHLAEPILTQAPPGAYMTVGTDRGFNNASSLPQITDLILVDRDPKVIWFNIVNRFLLQVATSREDYVQLRLNPSPHEWMQRLRMRQRAGLEIAPALVDIFEHPLRFNETVKDWNDYVVNNKDFNSFHTKATNEKAPFFKNYLFDDLQFNRIKLLADNNRIHILVYNFALGEITVLVSFLKAKGITISVLDISNAWEQLYISASKLDQMLMQFLSITTEKSVLLTTFVYKESKFLYHGFTFGLIEQVQKNFARLIYKRQLDSSPNQLHDRISCISLF